MGRISTPLKNLLDFRDHQQNIGLAWFGSVTSDFKTMVVRDSAYQVNGVWNPRDSKV